MILNFKDYSTLPNSVKASFWFIVSNVILKGISFITLPIFTRLLTPEEYGVVSVYASWVSIISILCTLTVWGGVFNVLLVQNKDNIDTVISQLQGLAVFVTSVFFLVSVIFLDSISLLLHLSRLLVIVIYVDIFTQIPFALWSGKNRYTYKYRAIVACTIFGALANPILGYLAVTSTTYKAEARILSGVAIQLLINVVLFCINQNRGGSFCNVKLWKYVAGFNIVLIPHYLSTQILNQSDRIMIDRMCGSGEAGIYSVAYTFAMLLTLITSGINSSFTPYIYKSLKFNNTDLSRIANQVVLGIAFVAFAVVCIIPDIFKYMLPVDYYPAMWIIPPVTVGAFFLFLYPLFGSVEFYYRENIYVTISSVIVAVVNVLLNYIFIPLFGFIAAGYTTLFCYVLYCVAHYFFMKRVLKKKNIQTIPYDMNRLIVISVSLVLASMITLAVYEQDVIRRLLVLGLFIFAIRYKNTDIVKNNFK